MSNDYGNWCPEIYRNIYIDRYNDDQVRVAPCCQAMTKLESVNTLNFNTSPYLTKLRNQINQGERPSECRWCWELEDIGQKSRRQSAIEFFNLDPQDTLVQLDSIDYNATWACNLACIMCGPGSSSTWATELEYDQIKLFEIGRRFQKTNTFLDKFDLTTIKKIHFNGGEPMLNNEQTTLLEQLEEQNSLKNTFISYNTNGTLMPSNKVVKLWEKAKLVKLFFSIDGTGSSYEYIRHPANWNQVSKNIKDMRDQLPGNVLFGFNIAVGSYNLLELADILKWFKENLATNREGDPSDFCWQFVRNYDIKNLTRVAKEQALVSLYNQPEVQGIITYVNSTINYTTNDAWINELEKIDQRRGTNWRNSLQAGKYY